MSNTEKTNSNDEPPILDSNKIQSIKDLGEGDDEFFIQLIDLFFERVPTLIGEIKEALKSKNSHKLERSSHALKGSSGNLGAMKLMQIAEILENKGRSSEWSGVELLVEDLAYLYPLTKQSLEEHRPN